MRKISTAIKQLKGDKRGFLVSLIQQFCFLFPDRLYLKMLYWLKLGRKLDLENPLRFTEKLQWLKLYNHNPLYTELVDKSKVKEHVARWIGEEHVIPTLGVWDSFEDIDFESLPEKFVLKTTNGSGGHDVVICHDKKQFNMEKARRIINNSLKKDVYWKLREWPYKGVTHRIIAEQYMEDETGELRDYKFFCFNGTPKAMLIASNRYTHHNFTYFDMDFHRLPITSVAGEQSDEVFMRPENFDEMVSVASRLSQNMPHVRVDLYTCQGKVYFGEITFFDTSGFDNMCSDEWDLKFGSWLTLSNLR